MAALYAFNMLQATMVEYDKKDTIVVGDITINTTSTRKDVENNTNTDGNIDGERNGDGLMQFGEKYFKDLEKKDATDVFGHPASGSMMATMWAPMPTRLTPLMWWRTTI